MFRPVCQVGEDAVYYCTLVSVCFAQPLAANPALLIHYKITHFDSSRGCRVFTAVCLFFRTISKKPMKLGSPNLP